MCACVRSRASVRLSVCVCMRVRVGVSVCMHARVCVCETSRASLTHGGGHLAPLQHHVLGDAAVRVDVDALVLVAHQQLDAVCVGQDDDSVGLDAVLDLRRGRTRCQGNWS